MSSTSKSTRKSRAKTERERLVKQLREKRKKAIQEVRKSERDLRAFGSIKNGTSALKKGAR